ncbi:nucleotidyltransferase [Halalkalibacterium halodurans]|uniref:nucleotidyltransferase n=1 Tax=Halalkalibacterium halodurans TaxID=86665 RepID=UPI001067E642|nr:nucleotidyltransferase [Halalkalibacterium halodurans]MED3647272.1 nucleotidyltransferase [Halalkalibacterium halodurans]TES53865.1 nucleotidyltransferase [Halalkalibacterium halodurans]
MKAVGVVVEYNPFHNGHLHHLTEARKQAKADVVIAVMSGYFLQRGEPAILPKWERTSLALQGGADLVVELPYAFSTQKAEWFATGAVSILAALEADALCFGSEEGTIEPFHRLYHFMAKHRAAWDRMIKEELDKGMSYPTATSLAFKRLEGSAEHLDLSRPNNILGFHYVKAIYDLHTSIKAMTIPRIKAGYHDDSLNESSIASATSIRKSLKTKEGWQMVDRVVPSYTTEMLKSFEKETTFLPSWERLFPLLKYRLLTATPEQLHAIYEGEEGLEYRALKTIVSATSFHDWMTKMKTKRYTWTRIQRYATHLFTNTTKEEIHSVLPRGTESLPYIRLLGMTSRGQMYLNGKKKQLTTPVITRPAKVDDRMMNLDLRAAFSYYASFPPSLQQKRLKEEFHRTPIRIDHKPEPKKEA